MFAYRRRRKRFKNPNLNWASLLDQLILKLGKKAYSAYLVDLANANKSVLDDLIRTAQAPQFSLQIQDAPVDITSQREAYKLSPQEAVERDIYSRLELDLDGSIAFDMFDKYSEGGEININTQDSRLGAWYDRYNKLLIYPSGTSAIEAVRDFSRMVRERDSEQGFLLPTSWLNSLIFALERGGKIPRQNLLEAFDILKRTRDTRDEINIIVMGDIRKRIIDEDHLFWEIPVNVIELIYGKAEKEKRIEKDLYEYPNSADDDDFIRIHVTTDENISIVKDFLSLLLPHTYPDAPFHKKYLREEVSELFGSKRVDLEQAYLVIDILKGKNYIDPLRSKSGEVKRVQREIEKEKERLIASRLPTIEDIDGYINYIYDDYEEEGSVESAYSALSNAFPAIENNQEKWIKTIIMRSGHIGKQLSSKDR